MNSYNPFSRPAAFVGKSRLVLFTAMALCLGLSACEPNTIRAAADPTTRYPMEVDSQLVTQPVVFRSGQVELDKVEAARLDAFLMHFMKSGGSVLEIRQTGDSADANAEARLQALRSYVLKRGARADEVRLRRIASTAGDSDLIIVSFEQFSVKPIRCTKRNAPTANNPANVTHPDFGCSLRSSIANMISNPADLQAPRRKQSGDAMRRDRVIQNYRAGKPTEVSRGKKERGSSISDLGG